MSSDLKSLRAKIDATDRALLLALAKRMNYVKTLGVYKQKNNIPTLDKERWNDVLASRMKTAQSKGLSPEFVRKIFTAIHSHSLSLQKRKK